MNIYTEIAQQLFNDEKAYRTRNDEWYYETSCKVGDISVEMTYTCYESVFCEVSHFRATENGKEMSADKVKEIKRAIRDLAEIEDYQFNF